MAGDEHEEVAQMNDPGNCIWKFQDGVWTVDESGCNEGFKCVDQVDGQAIDQSGLPHELLGRVMELRGGEFLNDGRVQIPCIPADDTDTPGNDPSGGN